MKQTLSMLLHVVAGCAALGGGSIAAAETAAHCSVPWYQSVEQRVTTGDGQGHGPDLGSDEWKSVVEFKLGVRGKPGVPGRDSEAWCAYIDQLIQTGTAAEKSAAGSGPSYTCSGVEPGGIEALICDDRELSALDRRLASVYASATAKATNEHPPLLKVEQRGWIKGRDDCWKSDDPRACVRDEYERRIVELQARYRLVAGEGPFRFVCDDNPANEVVVTFFETDPPTLIAERGDSVSLMVLQPSGSGTRYQGRNESYWQHQGEASIVWGYGAPEMRCTKAP